MDICKLFALDTLSFEMFSVLAPTFVGRPEPNISTLPNEPVEVAEPLTVFGPTTSPFFETLPFPIVI